MESEALRGLLFCTPTLPWVISRGYLSAPATQGIAEALRSAGIEVWFDREELRGGDAWNQKIRQRPKGGSYEAGLFAE